jgi:hypothetical protein
MSSLNTSFAFTTLDHSLSKSKEDTTAIPNSERRKSVRFDEEKSSIHSFVHGQIVSNMHITSPPETHFLVSFWGLPKIPRKSSSNLALNVSHVLEDVNIGEKDKTITLTIRGSLSKIIVSINAFQTHLEVKSTSVALEAEPKSKFVIDFTTFIQDLENQANSHYETLSKTHKKLTKESTIHWNMYLEVEVPDSTDLSWHFALQCARVWSIEQPTLRYLLSESENGIKVNTIADIDITPTHTGDNSLAGSKEQLNDASMKNSFGMSSLFGYFDNYSSNSRRYNL